MEKLETEEPKIIQAFFLMMDALSHTDVARKVGVSVNTIRRWRQIFRNNAQRLTGVLVEEERKAKHPNPSALSPRGRRSATSDEFWVWFYAYWRRKAAKRSAKGKKPGFERGELISEARAAYLAEKPLSVVKRIIKDNDIQGVKGGTQRLYRDTDVDMIQQCNPTVRGEELRDFFKYDGSKFKRFIEFIRNQRDSAAVLQRSGVLAVLDGHKKGSTYRFDARLIPNLLELKSLFEEQLNARPPRKKRE